MKYWKYCVYYDTATRRPSKSFDSLAEAVAWASRNINRRPVVVRIEETVVWDYWKATKS